MRTDRGTDRYEDGNSSFSQILGRHLKCVEFPDCLCSVRFPRAIVLRVSVLLINVRS
jgi:hypothetical protein